MSSWNSFGSSENNQPVPHTRIDDDSAVEKVYTLGKKLGQGSFGVVLEAMHNETAEKWAIKIINKEKAGSSAVKLLEREVAILKKVKHKHIILLKEVFETSQRMFLVMELCSGGELSALFQAKQIFNERETRTLISRLGSTIAYMHKNDIVHRDLKLDNILLKKDEENPDDELNIKVSDFGLSIVKGGVGSDAMMQTMCGTPMYMAPEVIDNQGYSQTCDIWSLGVIMYMLLSGTPPFVGHDEDSLYDAIRAGLLDFSAPVWLNISDEAKNTIMCLLKVNPAHRLTASELMDHPWITGIKSENMGPTNVLEMMKQWKDELKLEENGEVDNNANVHKDGMDDADGSESVKENDEDGGRIKNQTSRESNLSSSSSSGKVQSKLSDSSTGSKKSTASKMTKSNSSNSLSSKSRGGATISTPSKPATSRSRERAPLSSPNRPSQGFLKPSSLKTNSPAAKTSSQIGKPRSPKAGVTGSSSKNKRKPSVGS